jgi:sigma-B regulation protein RsbU (phosphoserine phosphatase)
MIYLSNNETENSNNVINNNVAKNDNLDFNILLEFSNLLNLSKNINFVLDNLLLSSMGKMMLSKGCIILKLKQRYTLIANKGVSSFKQDEEFVIDSFPTEIFYVDEANCKKHNWLKNFHDAELKLGVPIISKNDLLGIAFFSDKYIKVKYNDRDFLFLQALANIAAVTIENSMIVNDLQMANRNLDRRVQQLNTLFDIGREFSMLFDENRIVRLLSYSLMGQMGVNHFAVLLKEDDHFKVNFSQINNIENHCDDFLGLIDIKESGYVNSFEVFCDKISIKRIKAIGVEVIVPMLFHNRTKGIVLLSNRINNEPYSPMDMDFISLLSKMAALAMENNRLFKETLEKQRLEEEINIARGIQQRLLPKSLPTISDYDIFGITKPSKQVGGDYYEIMKVKDEEFLFAIADVSGKGLPASLIMANLQAIIRVLAPIEEPMTDKTKKINDIVYDNTDSSKFITFFWGILHSANNTFTYVNAGHNYPILLHEDGTFELLDKGGIILGVAPSIVPYECSSIPLKENDILFLYTDGVTESQDADSNEFGEKKLIEILKSNAHLKAKELAELIFNKIEEHAMGCQQYDDITMVVLKSVRRA